MTTQTKEHQLFSIEPIQRRGRIIWAQQHARNLLRACNVRTRDEVRVRAFTEHLEIEVVFCRLDGADAQLVRFGDRAIIYVSERLIDPAAIRFAVAHELGHFVLGHRGPTIANLTAREGKRTRYSPEQEAEANAFASELLMPRSLLRGVCDVTPLDLEVPMKIARDFDVSILTAAIRCTELTNQPCGAAFSVRGVVKWFARSASLGKCIQHGRLLRPGSLACRYFVDGTLDEGPHNVPAGAWFDTHSMVDIVEHAICSPQHGTVLSMLWIPEDVAPKLGVAA
jgi:hypothetical protein